MKTAVGTFQDGLCHYCKHWGQPCDEFPNMHACDHPKVIENHDDSMTVASGEPYNSGVFVTGPNFGCIHHEPKR